jgi:hypothetical protein
MKRQRSWLIIVLLPLLLFGCSLSEMDGPTDSVDSTQPASTANRPAAQPGDLGLDTSTNGLPSYRVQMLVHFTGQDDSGQAFQSTLTLAEETDQAQAAQHLLAKTEMSDQPPASFELYRLGEQDYLVSTEISSQAGCMRLDAEQSSVQPALLPKDIFTFIRLGDLVQSGETADGFVTDHYKLAEAGLGIGSAQGWNGDVWVAQQGGFIVRFSGSAEGEVTLTGRPGSGRLEWEYALNAENTVAIGLPEDCSEIGLPDILLPDGAQNLTQMGSQLSFTSQEQAAELSDFYRRALPESGWTIDEDAGAGSVFTLNASQEGRSIQVVITALEQGCQVTITRK